MGHQVKIVMPPWHTHESPAVWQEEGIEYEYVAINYTPLFGYLATTHNLVRAALAFKPDVVHCFKPKAYAGLAAYFIWRHKKLGNKVRLVVDEDDWEGDGGWNAVEPYPAALKRFFSWQERWGVRHCDALTVASRALQSIVWSLGVPPERVTYLPNGAPHMDLSMPGMRRTLQLKDSPTVLCYTRFVEFSPERLLAIWQNVHRELPAARLLIVGKALNAETEARLDRLLAGDLADTVLRAGWVQMADLPAYFSCADVAVFPCDDTLINRCKCSVKLTDLLTAGLPVVADAVGQNAEYIEAGRSGWLVSPGDNTAMAHAVTALLQDEAQRRALGSAARERMLSEFNWQKLAEIALQAYADSRSS